MEPSNIARALMEWARLRNRIKLLAYDIVTEYDREMGKHILTFNSM